MRRYLNVSSLNKFINQFLKSHIIGALYELNLYSHSFIYKGKNDFPYLFGEIKFIFLLVFKLV